MSRAISCERSAAWSSSISPGLTITRTSRPGARGENLEHYIKRLEALEELAAKHKGVEKVYALQAGREIRVLVKPQEIDDDGAVLLSHEIAREIEDQLEYPGQIKVTVIRESRAIEFAK